MAPWVRALIDFGHVLGAVIGVGGLIYAGLALMPASQQLAAEQRAALLVAVRQRARLLTYLAVGLLLGTGLLKWMPPGGVGWLGHGGYRTAFLHGKLVLALVVFHFALKLARAPASEVEAARRPRQAVLAAGLGSFVVLLAMLHQTGI